MSIAKPIKMSFWTILFVSLIATLFYQFKVESYRLKVNEEYSLFSDRERKKERKRYKPFVFFYIESKYFNQHARSWKNIYSPYQEKEIVLDGFVRFNIEFNAYLMYCYYDKS